MRETVAGRKTSADRECLDFDSETEHGVVREREREERAPTIVAPKTERAREKRAPERVDGHCTGCPPLPLRSDAPTIDPLHRSLLSRLFSRVCCVRFAALFC